MSEFPTKPAYIYRSKAVRVIDGDTFIAEIDLGFRVYTRKSVRLRGVDTPERGQEGWQEATAFLISLLFAARMIGLLIASYKDRQSFERWICDAYIIESDGSVLSVAELVMDAMKSRSDASGNP